MNTKSQKLNSNDIAQLADVSQATVSRVLSGNGYVSEKTRTRVLKAIKDANYQPNTFAQAMRTKQSGTVGVAVSRITNPIVPEILEALSIQFAANNRRLVVWNTDADGEGAILSAIGQSAVDGIIFTAASHQIEAMNAALECQIPTVSFNRYLENSECDQVVSTNFDGAKSIANYLVGHGRKRIAFVNGPLDRTTLFDREKGFRKGLEDADMGIQEQYYFQSEFSQEAFRQAAIDMMALPIPPDAISCGNDVIAFAVLNGLKACGASVPGDVWVTGFDGIEMSGWDVFDLTTMRQPLNQMAADAVTALIGRIEGHTGEPKLIQYRTEFCPRGTTKNLKLT